jgi:hypothetical protein
MSVAHRLRLNSGEWSSMASRNTGMLCGRCAENIVAARQSSNALVAQGIEHRPSNLKLYVKKVGGRWEIGLIRGSAWLESRTNCKSLGKIGANSDKTRYGAV